MNGGDPFVHPFAARTDLARTRLQRCVRSSRMGTGGLSDRAGMHQGGPPRAGQSACGQGRGVGEGEAVTTLDEDVFVLLRAERLVAVYATRGAAEHDAD